MAGEPPVFFNDPEVRRSVLGTSEEFVGFLQEHRHTMHVQPFVAYRFMQDRLHPQDAMHALAADMHHVVMDIWYMLGVQRMSEEFLELAGRKGCTQYLDVMNDILIRIRSGPFLDVMNDIGIRSGPFLVGAAKAGRTDVIQYATQLRNVVVDSSVLEAAVKSGHPQLVTWILDNLEQPFVVIDRQLLNDDDYAIDRLLDPALNTRNVEIPVLLIDRLGQRETIIDYATRAAARLSNYLLLTFLVGEYNQPPNRTVELLTAATEESDNYMAGWIFDRVSSGRRRGRLVLENPVLELRELHEFAGERYNTQLRDMYRNVLRERFQADVA